MTRCSCCERRQGYALDAYDCWPEYCPKCLLCHLHCDCTDEATVVDA